MAESNQFCYTHQYPHPMPIREHCYHAPNNPSQSHFCDPVSNMTSQSQTEHCSDSSKVSSHTENGRKTRYHHGVNIRQKERAQIKARLQPGRMVQICGPPMVGKCVTVKQAIEDIEAEKETNDSCFVQCVVHNFRCKQLKDLQSVLTTVAQKMCPYEVVSSTLDIEWVIGIMAATLGQSPQSHHILVFQKCENLHSNQQDLAFLEFLETASSELSKLLQVTIVFTTYKKFGVNIQTIDIVEIGVLSDFFDVISLLQYYAPQIEVLDYVHICQKVLCFPEAVRRLAEEFIADEACRVLPEVLERKISGDVEFLSRLFESRLDEVTDWIPQTILLSIFHFSHSIESSFTEAHLEHVSNEGDTLQWNRLIRTLRQNYVVRMGSTADRWVVHPLIMFYCMTRLRDKTHVLQGQWYDASCSKYVNFLCRILMKTETNVRLHGVKGLAFGCLVEEWPHVKYLIEMALHVNTNTYDSFLKVAIAGSSLIMRCFPREAREFYLELYNSARQYGSRKDCAVLEAFLGHIIIQGSGQDWQRSERHLNSAIEKLTSEGPSFFLTWALSRKAIALHRQGRYDESLKFFKKSRKVSQSVDKRALGEKFSVSQLQLDEERITREIHETIPIVFKGKHELAQQRLDAILELINTTCENHSELAIVLNTYGLNIQRGNNDLNEAVTWYKRSLNERQHLVKIAPDNLIPVLNNIAMILYRQGKLDECMKYLQQALDIRREYGWKHYFTALTLTHVNAVNMSRGDIVAAYKNCLEAEDIHRQVARDHHSRLSNNLTLSHLRAGVRQLLEPDSVEKNEEMQKQREQELEQEIYQHFTNKMSEPNNKKESLLNNGEKLHEDKIKKLTPSQRDTSNLDIVSSEDSVTNCRLQKNDKEVDGSKIYSEKRVNTPKQGSLEADTMVSKQVSNSQQTIASESHSRNTSTVDAEDNGSLLDKRQTDLSTDVSNGVLENVKQTESKSSKCQDNNIKHQTESPQDSNNGNENILRFSGLQSEIDPEDLRSSSEDFLIRVLEITSEMRGSFSDDSHLCVLEAHEHAMLLNWGNCRETFEKHRKGYLQYIQDKTWMESLFKGENTGVTKHSKLLKHKDIYIYVLNTRFEDLDLEKFVGLLVGACHVCQYSTSYCSKEFWVREAKHLMRERNVSGKVDSLFDNLRLDTSSDSDDDDVM